MKKKEVILPLQTSLTEREKKERKRERERDRERKREREREGESGLLCCTQELFIILRPLLGKNGEHVNNTKSM
jgi:hypothetical protein